MAAVLLERMRGLPLDTVVLSYQCRRCGPVPIRLQQIDPNPIRVEMTR